MGYLFAAILWLVPGFSATGPLVSIPGAEGSIPGIEIIYSGANDVSSGTEDILLSNADGVHSGTEGITQGYFVSHDEVDPHDEIVPFAEFDPSGEAGFREKFALHIEAAPYDTVVSEAADQTPASEEVNLAEEELEIASDLVLFFGRFHPFLVHLPIGFLLFAILLEFVSLIRRFEYLKDAVPFALLVGVLSGIAAGATGYLLSQGGGYSEEALESHKWLGISLILIAIAAFIVRVRWYEHPAWRKLFRGLLILLAAIVMTTGHYGGSLTHGSDYLFRYMPEPMRSWSGVEIEEEEQIALLEDLDSAHVYHDIIHPIIRTRCQSCHNYDRTEGELLMTSYNQLMEGGESGPVIVKNRAEESELYRRLILPDRDEDRMPPRGRRQLTHDQIQLIRWWIDAGTPSNQTVAELEISDEMFAILNKLTVAGQSFYARTEVPEADREYLDSLRAEGINITPIAEGMNFLQVRFSKSRTSVGKEDFSLLIPLKEQITWLDLNRMTVSEEVLVSLSEFRNLTRLNLSNTAAGDRTLEIIGTLENLEYLNIYATEVGDQGVRHLEGLHNLQSLYLWRTNVSEEAIRDLQSSHPRLYINHGYELGRVESP